MTNTGDLNEPLSTIIADKKIKLANCMKPEIESFNVKIPFKLFHESGAYEEKFDVTFDRLDNSYFIAKNTLDHEMKVLLFKTYNTDKILNSKVSKYNKYTLMAHKDAIYLVCKKTGKTDNGNKIATKQYYVNIPLEKIIF